MIPEDGIGTLHVCVEVYHHWTVCFSLCSQEIKDLQEQVRDLMFYLETQKKVAETSEETRQVGAPPHSQGRSGNGITTMQAYAAPHSILAVNILWCVICT